MINEEILEELKDFFAYYDNDIIIDNLEYFLYLGEDIVKIINIVTRKDYPKTTYHEYITKILSNNNLEAIKLKYSDMTDNLDPERLDKLKQEEQTRLLKKYTLELDRIKNYLQERNCLYE